MSILRPPPRPRPPAEPRLQSMLDHLPVYWDARSHGSRVRQLLAALAVALDVYDDDAARVLRDRFWRTAGGGRDPGEAPPSALEGIGALVDLPRLRWRQGPEADPIWEPTAVYRRRLRATTTVTRSGLASPVAILQMVAATLDCRTDLDHHRVLDTTIAETEPNIAAERKREGIQQLQLIDNPLVRRELRFDPVAVGAEFAVANHGLLQDLPVLRITAPVDADLVHPQVENRELGYGFLYAGVLPAGETLVVEPDPRPWLDQSPADWPRFANHEGIDPHPWLRGHPTGRARLQMSESGVDDRCWYFRYAGRYDQLISRFFDPQRTPADAVLDRAARFLHYQPGPVTPLVGRGRQTWRLRSLSATEVEHLIGEPPAAPAAPPMTVAGTATIGLSWWTRRAAHFRVRLDASPFMAQARRRGLGLAVLDAIERVRPAGVGFDLDFPVHLPPEVHDHEARLARAATLHPSSAQDLRVAQPSITARRPGGRPVILEPRTGPPTFGGRFDITRWDGSHFLGGDGRLDDTPLDDFVLGGDDD